MPRYYFHIQDGRFNPDETGTVLPDLASAQVEAIVASGEMLRDKGLAFWAERSWEMRVHDEAQTPLFTLTVRIHEHG